MDIDGDPAFGAAPLYFLYELGIRFGESECVQCIILHDAGCTVYMEAGLILCKIVEHETDMRIFKYIPQTRHYTVSAVFRIDDGPDRKSTRLNSSYVAISYAVFCLKKKIHLLKKNSQQT